MNSQRTHRKLAIITGTGGLGFEVARRLAEDTIDVILAGRNQEKGASAVHAIQARAPRGQVSFKLLDLACLESIMHFSESIGEQYPTIDILVNNAGIMAPPEKRLTTDGFELQLGTNYLGHFALTQQLLPQLLCSKAARVVNVTSLAYKTIKNIGGNLFDERPYKPFEAYAESKLAQLFFALELQRRSEHFKWPLMSIAAHPGFASTGIFKNQQGGISRAILNLLSAHIVQPLLGQSAADGALPILYAATSNSVCGGELYGPSGFLEMRGTPAVSAIDTLALNPELAASLWAMSEQLTRLEFPHC